MGHGKSYGKSPGWWFGTMELYDFPYIGKNNPNSRTPSFFRGAGIPPTSYVSIIYLLKKLQKKTSGND
jgi:hypothetical protein